MEAHIDTFLGKTRIHGSRMRVQVVVASLSARHAAPVVEILG